MSTLSEFWFLLLHSLKSSAFTICACLGFFLLIISNEMMLKLHICLSVFNRYFVSSTSEYMVIHFNIRKYSTNFSIKCLKFSYMNYFRKGNKVLFKGRNTSINTYEIKYIEDKSRDIYVNFLHKVLFRIFK